jgi:hypothetical protein
MSKLDYFNDLDIDLLLEVAIAAIDVPEEYKTGRLKEALTELDKRNMNALTIQPGGQSK